MRSGDRRISKVEKATTNPTKEEIKMKKNKKKKSLYEEMVTDLSVFVIRTANKDNPTNAEVNAMVEIAKLLSRTV